MKRIRWALFVILPLFPIQVRADLTGGLVKTPNLYSSIGNPSSAIFLQKPQVDAAYSATPMGYAYAAGSPFWTNTALSLNGSLPNGGAQRLHSALAYQWGDFVLGLGVRDLISSQNRAYDLSFLVSNTSFSWGLIGRSLERQLAQIDLVSHWNMGSGFSLSADLKKPAPLQELNLVIDLTLGIELSAFNIDLGYLSNVYGTSASGIFHTGLNVMLSDLSIGFYYNPYSTETRDQAVTAAAGYQF